MRETSLCLLVLISFFQICDNKNQPKVTGHRVHEYFQQPRVPKKNAPTQRFGGGNRNLKGDSACKDKASNCREAAKGRVEKSGIFYTFPETKCGKNMASPLKVQKHDLKWLKIV